METRKIMIANTKTQQKYSIDSSAETLGELKAQLMAQGIDYTGLSFTEGISKTELVNDSDRLPTNVMYKGAPTNNLVMLLTNTKKNIASGAMSRKEAYAFLKEHPEVAESIKVNQERNYTQVATNILEDYITDYFNAQPQGNTTKSTPSEGAPKKEEKKNPKKPFNKVAKDIIFNCIAHTVVTVGGNIITPCEKEMADELSQEIVTRLEEQNNFEISDAEIDAMINNL